MGYDAFSESAVLLKPESLRPLFRSRSFAVAMAAKLLARHSEELQSIGRDGRLVVQKIWDVVNDPEATVDRGDAIERLQTVKNGTDLFDILRDCLYAEEPGDNGKVVSEVLWNDVIECYNLLAGTELPHIASIQDFAMHDDTDLSGCNVECGHPYLAFRVDCVFEQVLTRAGNALSAALGVEPEISEWISFG